MSGYRTIKRALGETNLERKCRVLFGLCLALLIFVTFSAVDWIGENLVHETIRQMGKDWANISLYRLHWHALESNERFRSETLTKFDKDLLTEDYRWEVLGDGQPEAPWMRVRPPIISDNPAEAELIRGLREKWLAQSAANTDASPQSEDSGDPLAAEEAPFEPAFGELTSAEERRYYYYQPVYWKSSCSACHGEDTNSIAASDPARAVLANAPPFRVIKVIMPDTAMRGAITQTRALLLSVGILTIFLAMVALYVIVRYVIVKPLKHLRDVSEEISQGNTDLRAEINTNDEFEELAHAFNRMLRHMTDAQAELRQLNVSLDNKVDELAQLNMRLYDMNRLKSDFLANMSHELRTPLNSIIGFSEVLQGIDSLNEKQRRYALNIQKSGRVLLDMINDILDLAKLEAGKMELRPSEFRLATVISAQCDMVRPLTEVKNIDLNVIVDYDEPPCYQDQGKVQQVLTNLLSNAIKFTPEGGRITVDARRIDDALTMIVSDTGVGIPKEDREVIFEKFRQSAAVLDNDGLTREYSGTGLGLSIVRELCKLLGGEVTFDSQLGQGSTFQVVLPWDLTEKPKFSSELSQKLAELASPDREEFREHTARPV